MSIANHGHNETSGKLARSVAATRYGTSTMVKMQRAPYTELLEALHLAGKCNILEVLLMSHAENPYQTVDELIGDIQVALVEHNDQFKKTAYGRQVTAVRVEDLIQDHQLRRQEIQAQTKNLETVQ